MKRLIPVVQVLVGLLFIISGLVKANDPVGLGYKMQEFFELWSAGFAPGSLIAQGLHLLHGAALGLSVFMITLEILLGVALLLGWMKKLVLWLLLLLIVFFTFLTGYAYMSGKFSNCGCFGDCLPITPLTSFLKDIVLLVLILLLLAGRRHIRTVLTAAARTAILMAALVFSVGLQWYVLQYLPLADCLPFKKGHHLPAYMKPPPGSVTDSFAIVFVYEKGGKQFEFAPEELPGDFDTYTYVDRRQKLVRKGNAEAPIKGFTLTNGAVDPATGNQLDSTPIVLSQPAAVLLFAVDFSDPSWIKNAAPVVKAAAARAIPFYVISPNRTEAQAAFARAGINNASFFNTDFTLVRTVARTNPTLLYLQTGTVQKKWSKKEMDKAAAYINSHQQ